MGLKCKCEYVCVETKGYGVLVCHVFDSLSPKHMHRRNQNKYLKVYFTPNELD